ncbi:MAG TPA: zf-HC2 domain-containing protein [Acidobacteriota bacterium]|nr:zf-HC2 domain-containing protein [Acidobacteriota bacterium]
MKHLIEEHLILYYYGEAQDEASIEEHLASCESCRSEFQELKRVLLAIDALPVPQRSSDYGGEVWRRLQPQLRERSCFRWPSLLRPRYLAWAGAMAVLVVGAFITGRLWQQRPPEVVEDTVPGQTSKTARAQIRERVLLASVADHLERSQMILLDLSNMALDGKIDISADRAWAQELLAENRIYRQSALKSGEAGVASVLDDLERILLEVANSPTQVSGTELGELRQRIDAQGVVFKLRIIGSSMRRKQAEEARELARRTS